jgi:hypothetical protein
MEDILNSIFDFCKVRNKGPVYSNGTKKSPRVEFILSILDKNGISYELDEFEIPHYSCRGFNIILKGENKRMVIAHHDIVNPNSDNANDNSASVINAIYLKSILPEVNVVITDGEEFGFLGAKRLAKQIKEGRFGEIEWVLNLELTGKGGINFFIGDYGGKLSEKIKNLFNPPTIKTPGNDCIPLISMGIDTSVINSLPLLKEGKSLLENENGFLDIGILRKCHSEKDSIDDISVEEMKFFVENILIPITKD